MAPNNFHRNLESGQVFISAFHSGLYTQRNPLYTPLSAMGLQMVSRLDTLWDGLNIEVSNGSTLVRRPGFPKYSTAQFGSSSYPLAFYSFKNNAGTIKLLVDAPDKVYTFDTTSLTAVFTKAATAQTSFQKVGNTVYMCNGTDAEKWNGTTASAIGITTPASAPSLAFVANGNLSPTSGFKYGFCGKNSSTGHVSTMSPPSASTGPLSNNTVVESNVTVAVTNIALTTNVITVTCANNFKPGQSVLMGTMTTATFLNGVTLTVVSASGSQFTAAYVHANYPSAADTGTCTMTVSVPNSPYIYTVAHGSTFLSDGGVKFSATSLALTSTGGAPTTGQYNVNTSTGAYTFAAADAGKGIVVTYTYALAVSTGVNIQVSSTGYADPQVDQIEIYRTEDGGSIYYFLADIANPGVSTWTYTDSTLDSGLDTFTVAPIDDANDPPASGMSLLTYHMGRLWGASGNAVYFAAGPDTTNGVGEEAWPPANVFTFPGKVTALASTSAGLLAFTSDAMYVIYGTQTAAFYSTLFQKNFGVLSQNCVAQDGDLLFVYTSSRQLFQFDSSISEIGFPIGDKFQTGFNPATSYLALHRNGSDSGLFISDGSTNIYKYRIDQASWSPVTQVGGGAGALAGNIETAAGTNTLLTGRTTGSGYILGRSLTNFQDEGVSYSAYATIGTLVLSAPGTTSVVKTVTVERMPVGTDAIVSVSLNEINGTFTVLPNPVNDPPLISPSTTVIAKRHSLSAAQTPLAAQCRHLLVKVAFATEAAKNELLSLALN